MELIRLGTSKKIKLDENTLYILGRRKRSDQAKRISRLQVSLRVDSTGSKIQLSNLGINSIKVDEKIVKYRERLFVKGDFEIELPDNVKYRGGTLDLKNRAIMNNEDSIENETEAVVFEGTSKDRISDCEIIKLSVFDNLKREVESTELVHGWNELDNGRLMVLNLPNGGGENHCNLAAFDMDGTVIKTRSGKTFPVDENDWIFYSDKVENKIRSLKQEGYAIVIFSNQGGIAFGSTNKKKLKTKIERVVKTLDVPMQVYLAAGYDFYRKPCPGMWFSYQIVNNCSIDYDNSIYVGDAAGRPQNWSKGKKKDFSMADRLFARNVNVKFETPEEFFHGENPVGFNEPDFDPNKLSVKSHSNYNLTSKREVILMVGSPGSGKSHFVKKFLLANGYVSISRDVLNTWQNCVKAAEKYLSLNKSIVIDNTNPNTTSREKFIDVARSNSAPVRCFIMESHSDLCKHNNKFRQLTDKDHTLVTDVIINDYWKKYEEPTLEEGFEEIIKIPFVPNFQYKVDEALYNMYLN